MWIQFWDVGKAGRTDDYPFPRKKIIVIIHRERQAAYASELLYQTQREKSPQLPNTQASEIVSHETQKHIHIPEAKEAVD